MHVSKINAFSFGNSGACEHRQLNEGQKFDLLIKKINTLQNNNNVQMDIEKMRARQQLADRIMATGNVSNQIKILNKLA